MIRSSALLLFVPSNSNLSVISLLAVFTLTIVGAMAGESDDYIQKRQAILHAEKNMFIGSQIKLTDREKEVNDIVLKVKKSELHEGYKNVSSFLAAQHFFDARKKIEQSEMFSIIKKIPKGGSLHTHYLSAVSVDFIIKNITYLDNIYGCDLNGTFKLSFVNDTYKNTICEWKKLEDYRKQDPNFDEWLRGQLSLVVDNPGDVYPTANTIWTKFKKTFSTQYDMVCYRPVFEMFIYQLLKELYLDNVMYTELRGTIMPLFDLNGTLYSNKESLEIFVQVVEQFKKDNPGFLGVRYIHSVYRGFSPDDLRKDLQDLVHLKKSFPDFIAGFDLVGYEEEGRTLFEVHDVLMDYTKELKFFFHAGETNWFGHTDENLLDAVLLDSSRIGHGFGMNKHPVVMLVKEKLVKEKNICIELCPISNQVLMLIRDPRNHPAVGLMANGFPVVICNDDPSAWEATGLSYDWYVAFMAMTSEENGIQVLKQFAINSIVYSAMGDSEKQVALSQWESSWQKFIDEILALYANKV
ncbi:LOW QUALITY PROTEIN: adenosine deaminase 2-like [Diabrotica virgifera virgifera]|uniref:adenosine deaminase n=1 Tax=Diabrotica virgifera virgifera TaxID=50390 RepID=A0ABM5KJM1_DIAVI|nr:LOW QUALITY PROTEIN: adenosine deaminase 2-like [Diabrotica virgifera virgifera]